MCELTVFRGRRACTCQAQWIPALERKLQQMGLLAPGRQLTIAQLIGNAAASAGTHGGGGAIDIWETDERIHRVIRDMGGDAEWKRVPPLFALHTHIVLRGCPRNGRARYQITAVDAGFNGLGAGGRGGPDDGPRPLSGRTWSQGIAWALGVNATSSATHQPLTSDGGEPVNPVIYVADKTKGLLAAGALVYGGRAYALRDAKTRERLRDNGVPEVWFAPGGQQLNDFVNDLQKSGTRDSWPMLINVDGRVVYSAHGGFVELPKDKHLNATVKAIRTAFRDVETVHMPKWLYESVLNSVRSGNAP